MKPKDINYYFALSSVDSSAFLLANDDKNITIYHSKDDGLSWPIIYTIPSAQIINYNTNAVDFTDENTLFFPIEMNNQINRLTLNPFSWLASRINSELTIENIKMIDYERGIAGNSNQIFITKDSWENYNTIKVNNLQCLWYDDNESITYVSSSPQAVFHKSLDKGQSWETVKIGDFAVTKLYFIDNNTGIVIGNIVDTNSSPFVYKDIIYRTSDGGKSWKEVLNSTRNERSELNDIVFSDTKLGIATGTSNSVYTTNDGGLSWQKQTLIQSINSPPRITHCGFTKSKFIISVDNLGLYFIDFKKVK
jgi:hypothetical protein